MSGQRRAPGASNPPTLVSTVLKGGAIVETLYRPDEARTLFCVGENGICRETEEVTIQGQRYVPFSPQNNLLSNQVVLFPSATEEYGTEAELLEDLQSFLHRYVDLSPAFERVAAHYALFTWVHDAFNEIPYLRARGDFGTGKTRFLLTIGSVCYKPIFASGASTVSPLFRMLDAFRGTLVIDESDFRASDEKTEITKILNQGNSKGFPVLRTEATSTRELNPRAYQVFGPKIVASRGFFEDRALESRFLTEDLGHRPLRADLPINLPAEFHSEALKLRNKLLLFRMLNLHSLRIQDELADPTVQPRLNQIFVPLLSTISNPQARDALSELVREYNRELLEERGEDSEAQVLQVISDLLTSGEEQMSIKAITAWFMDRYGDGYERKVTTRWIGIIVRRQLRLRTHKSHGEQVITLTEQPKIKQLCRKYGLSTDTAETDAAEEASVSGKVTGPPSESTLPGG